MLRSHISDTLLSSTARKVSKFKHEQARLRDDDIIIDSEFHCSTESTVRIPR